MLKRLHDEAVRAVRRVGQLRAELAEALRTGSAGVIRS